ncbi:MAG: hypothetical protein Q8P21_02835 [bacterium]|nr:hypothetical protein [bacterium]
MKTAIVIILIGVVAAGIIYLAKSGPTNLDVPANNTSIVDGVQIVEIVARGGYQPRKSVAQAGIPTILRFKTNGTFDCSLSLRIPSQNVSLFLPQSGNTDIDIGTPEAGTLQGMCSMGMYRFSVEFLPS